MALGIFLPENMTAGGLAVGSEGKPSGTIIQAGYHRLEPQIDKNTGQVKVFEGGKAASAVLALQLTVHCAGHDKPDTVELRFGDGSLQKWVPNGNDPVTDEEGNVIEGLCGSFSPVEAGGKLHENSSMSVFMVSLLNAGMSPDEIGALEDDARGFVGMELEFSRKVMDNGSKPKEGQKPITQLVVTRIVGKSGGKKTAGQAGQAAPPAAKRGRPAGSTNKPASSAPTAPTPAPAPSPAAGSSDLISAVQSMLAENENGVERKSVFSLLKNAGVSAADALTVIKPGGNWLESNAEAGGWTIENGVVSLG